MQLKLTIGIYLSDTWLQFFMNTIADVSALEYAHIQIRLNCFDFGMVLHGLTVPPQQTEKHRKQSHKWAQVVWSSDQKCDLFYKVGLVICHFEDQHAFVGSLCICDCESVRQLPHFCKYSTIFSVPYTAMWDSDWPKSADNFWATGAGTEPLWYTGILEGQVTLFERRSSFRTLKGHMKD